MWPAHLMFAGVGAMHGAAGWLGEHYDPYRIDDCGARLSKHLNAGRAVSTKRRRRKKLLFDGLTANQIMGLSSYYTRRELDRARRTFARRLHPDLTQHMTLAQRATAEDALKRVNAAYDELVAGAMERISWHA